MKTYFYQDGTEVKENDIVFYSEDDGSNQWHYADAIELIVKKDDDLFAKAFITTMNEAKSFEEYEELEVNMVSLKYGCESYFSFENKKENTLQHFTKIGELPNDKYMLTEKYANSKYVTKKC